MILHIASLLLLPSCLLNSDGDDGAGGGGSGGTATAACPRGHSTQHESVATIYMQPSFTTTATGLAIEIQVTLDNTATLSS